MLPPDIRSQAIKRAVANSTTTWMEKNLSAYVEAVEKDMPIEEWEKRVAALSPEETRELAHVIGRVPTSYTFGVLDQVVTTTMRHEHFAGLGSEDRRYLAEARGHLMDALSLLREGDFRKAYNLCSASRERINWVANERARTSSEPKRQLTAAVMDLLQGLITALEGCERLLRGALSL